MNKQIRELLYNTKMNERIRKLAEQAQGTKKYVPPVWQFYDEELQKFAYLIIKECVAIVNDAEQGGKNEVRLNLFAET